MTMGIFSGIEILFFVLGAMTVLLIFGLIRMKKTYTMDWKAVTLAGIGIFLVVFCTAWSVSSVLEGEPQAASMGLLVFGLPVLVVFGVFRRIIKKVDLAESN
jgi:multisubunit Na+/H+ antiporter MnhG subunit